MNDQKNRSFPYPKGCFSEGGCLKKRRPKSYKTWLVVSASECKVYVIMHDEPVMIAPISFKTVISPLAISAPRTANIPYLLILE